jgi:beta-ribofuranosylaminobenzene 5'-phosphate synthase
VPSKISKQGSTGGSGAKVSVKTPSRLHFCLIDMNGDLGRVDGSLGLSIDKPNYELTAWLSDQTRAYGDDTRKVETKIRDFLSRVNSKEKVTVKVDRIIPSHVGFGSETQLSLAVASSVARILGLQLSVPDLAKIMGRGGTSGIGVAAFEKGGLILDGGHSFGKDREKQFFLPSNASTASPARIIARYDFPEDWGFVLAVPNVDRGAHGQRETEIFRSFCPIPSDEVSKITRVILMKLLPSLLERDIETFGSGLSDLQGLGFAKAARNLMNPVTAKCIHLLMSEGAYGAGQSSFGPAAYGLIKNNGKEKHFLSIIKDLLDDFGGGEVFFTGPNNTGASLSYA